jgi:hypothetical protein
MSDVTIFPVYFGLFWFILVYFGLFWFILVFYFAVRMGTAMLYYMMVKCRNANKPYPNHFLAAVMRSILFNI